MRAEGGRQLLDAAANFTCPGPGYFGQDACSQAFFACVAAGDVVLPLYCADGE